MRNQIGQSCDRHLVTSIVTASAGSFTHTYTGITDIRPFVADAVHNSGRGMRKFLYGARVE